MIWVNGAMLATGMAAIDPADRGYLLGDGLFETMVWRNGAVAHFDRHMQRLRAGARVLGIPLAWSDRQIVRVITRLRPVDGGVLRLTLSRGPGPRGLSPPDVPQPVMSLQSASPAAQTTPARLMLCTATRRNEWSPTARLKTLNYLDSIIARTEATDRGADDAVMLNTRGVVAEATAANLFALFGTRLVTPPITDGALPGITRGLIVERHGVREETMTPDDLRQADMVFLSSALGLRPVIAFAEKAVGTQPDMLRRIEAAIGD